MLRRQAVVLEVDPLPLVVMTPKSLLRNPKIASSLKELSEGKWQPVIDDDIDDKSSKKVKRLILCSGKVYVDLTSSELRDKNRDIAIARVEQLYPLPKDEIENVINRYSNLKEVVWLQEEPQNMGAWSYMMYNLRRIVNNRVPLHYIGRKRNSSPAEGSLSMHKVNQETLIEQAFNIKKDVKNLEESGIIWDKNI